MGWRDRDYNKGSGGVREFFGNPATILSLALPIGRWFGSRVTLHFWFLLQTLFIMIDAVRYGRVAESALAIVVLFVLLLVHEFSHRFVARRVDGHHEEFVLWMLGGMNSVQAPPRAKALFLANVAGPVGNLVTFGLAAIGLLIMKESVPFPPLNPLSLVNYVLMWPEMIVLQLSRDIFLASLLSQIAIYSAGMALVNLILPYVWFDGAAIWQAILWPLTGVYRAIWIVCVAGMVLAVPMFLLELRATNLLGLILWALLFSSSWNRWQQLKAGGLEGTMEMEYAQSTFEGGPGRKKGKKRWFKAAAKKAARERAEQAQIDAILAKVHDKGLHSLSWFEKRALRKATERQRQRDLAERL